MSGDRAACPFALHVPPYITPAVPCTVEGLHVWHSSGDLWWRFDPALEVQSYPPRAEEVLPPVPPRAGLNEFGEPTHDLVVETWRDVPDSISGHAMFHAGPGVAKHARLGITIVVLGEIRAERQAALAEIHSLRGDVREARGEVERLRALLAAGATRVLDLEAELEGLRDTDDVLRVDLALRDAEVAGLNLELERLRIVETASIGAHALLDDAQAEVERLRALTDAPAWRVVKDALTEVERLRALVGDAIDAGARNDGDAIDRIHREAGLT